MKKLVYIYILLNFTNCRYFNISPVDGITTKNLTEKPTLKEIVGSWEVDGFSYKLNEDKGYERKNIILHLNENETFEIINLPNYIYNINSTKEKFINTNGTWDIVKDYNNRNWCLKLNFNKSLWFENGMSTLYDLYLQNNKLIIWNFIGDPDVGERFLYKKQTISN